MTLAEFAAHLDEFSTARIKVVTNWLLNVGYLKYNNITNQWQLHVRADNVPSRMSGYTVIGFRITNNGFCYVTVDWTVGDFK